MLRSLLFLSLVFAALPALAEPSTTSAVAGSSLSYGLEFLFRHDDTGTRLADSVGGRDLTPAGDRIANVYDLGRVVRRYPGTTGTCFKESRTIESLSVGNAKDWTLAAVIRVPVADTNYGFYCSGSGSNCIAAYVGVTTIKVDWKKTGSGYVNVTSPTIKAGEWMLVTFWHDATANTLNVAVNDGPVVSASSTDAVNSIGEIRIGSDIPGNVLPFKGDMSTVAKWSRILTANERAALYGNGIFPRLEVAPPAAPALFSIAANPSDPIAGLNAAVVLNSQNREHVLINSYMGGYPAGELNANVASLWHHDGTLGNSAMRFRLPGASNGQERGAIGRGAAHPWNATFIEASNLDGTSAPDEFRLIQTGVLEGAMGAYIRLSIKPDGSFNWTAKDGTTNQLKIDLPGNVIVGGVIATTATDGFFSIPSCAGPPTGAAADGSMVRDSTNHKVYIRSGGNWIALN